MKKVLSLAYYLPQFHEIKENNIWWGKGFTEWTNINNAKSYFPNHSIRKPIQPLGQYNLLDKSTLEHQSSLAKKHGIDGFIVWNYWFGNGEKILEKPIELVLKNEINFNFCFAWANHSWINKSKGVLLKEQKYLGEKDYTQYFNYLLPFFKKSNYIKINNKPIFTIFRPQDIPDLTIFIETFNKLAKKEGLNGIFFIAENSNSQSNYLSLFDKFCNSNSYLGIRYKDNLLTFIKEKINNKLKIYNLGPFIYDYTKLVQKNTYEPDNKYIPTVFSGWDTTPRHGKNGLILKNFTLENFKYHLNKIKVQYPKTDIIIIKSWNEWAEGNIMEPDSINENLLLDCYKQFIQNY